MEKLYYTPKEVRELIFANHISISTIMSLIHNGQIESVKFNRKFFIPKSFVERMIAKANDSQKIS